MPGYGESPTIEPYTLDGIAIELEKLIIHLKIEKFSLIGHSMGGYVSLAYIRRYRDRVQKLVMLNSTAYPDSEEKKMQRDKTVAYLYEHGVSSFITPFVPPLFYFKNREVCKPAIDALIETGLKIPLETIISCTKAMRDRPDSTDIISQIQIPILYVIGKEDAAVKFEDSIAQVALSPMCKPLVLDETGHQALYERQELVLREIINFLNSF
jgi:pimeloyl-ACP methyl ester carboxylesterase